MPDISKINALAIGSVAKVDGLAKASILDIDGVAVPSAFTGLLDTYTGAVAAYSVRKLKTGVTVAMRIRRSGDDIEADVEFDSNNQISLTSPISNASSGTYNDLADFVDHTGTPRFAYCVEWKDQSGNGNHVDQPTAGGSGFQPKLYDATTGLNNENGKPALLFDTDKLGDVTVSIAQPFTSTFVMSSNGGSNTFNAVFGSADALGVYGGFIRRTTNWWMQSNALADTGQAHDTSQHLFYSVWDGASSEFAQDGGSATTLNPGATDWTNLAIGTRGTFSASAGSDGNYQELVIWGSDQSGSGNRTGIEENINSDYLIYQPTDAPTSGLLATYTGAAAAYSVRQLSDKAVIAMRIRRDSDDEERNIGFDSNGDLDTTAISAFCGTANGYVTRWWDQSTNSEHANQDTDTLQPQIYNGTSVFTNGSPARPEIRATTNARMVLGTLAHDVDRKYFAATTASVSSFCVMFGSNSTADYELLAQSGSTSSIFDGGGAIVNRNGSLWYDAPTLDKDRDDVWTDFSNQSIVMIDHVMALVTGRTTQLGYATNGIPMFHMQELIIYPTGTSHAVSDIENAINSYFQVYT